MQGYAQIGPFNITLTLFGLGLERLRETLNSAEETTRNDVMLRIRVLHEFPRLDLGIITSSYGLVFSLRRHFGLHVVMAP